MAGNQRRITLNADLDIVAFHGFIFRSARLDIADIARFVINSAARMRVNHTFIVQLIKRGGVGFEQRVLPLLFELEHSLLNTVRGFLLLRESRQGHRCKDDRKQKGSFHIYNPFKNDLLLFGFTTLIPPEEWIYPAVT